MADEPDAVLPELRARLNDISRIITDLPKEIQAQALGDIENLASNLKGQLIKAEPQQQITNSGEILDDQLLATGSGLLYGDDGDNYLSEAVDHTSEQTDNNSSAQPLLTSTSLTNIVQQEKSNTQLALLDDLAYMDEKKKIKVDSFTENDEIFAEEISQETFVAEIGIDGADVNLANENVPVVESVTLDVKKEQKGKEIEDAVEKLVNKVKVEKCLVCRKKFNDKDTLKEHMQNIHKIKIDLTSSKKPEKKKIAISKAEDYGQGLTSIKNEEDREEQSEKLFQIGKPLFVVEETIDGISVITSDVTNEANVQNNELTCYKCPLCDKLLTREKGLKQHMTRFHLNEMSTTCDVCHKTYSTYQRLVSHRRAVHGEKRHYCDQCSYITKHSLDLKRHMIRFHGNKEDYPYECETCGKRFITSTTLRKHSEVHKAHRPLIDCPEENCEFQTRSNMSMKIHMRNKHEGKQKFFVCEFCGKRLGAKATYETHLRRHRAQYIFKCVKCPAAFPCRTQLAAHSRIHQDKMYECEVCGKKFNSKPKVQRHMVVHTGEKKHVCPWCPYKCNLDSNLRKHCVSRHNIEFPPKRRPVVRLEVSGQGEGTTNNNSSTYLPRQQLTSNNKFIQSHTQTVEPESKSKLNNKEDKVELLLSREDDGTVDTDHIVKFLESQDFYGQQAVQVEVAGETFIISNKKNLSKGYEPQRFYGSNSGDTHLRNISIQSDEHVNSSTIEVIGAGDKYLDANSYRLKQEESVEDLQDRIQLGESVDERREGNEELIKSSPDSEKTHENMIMEDINSEQRHIVDGDDCVLNEETLQQVMGTSGAVVVIQQPDGTYHVQQHEAHNTTVIDNINHSNTSSSNMHQVDISNTTLDSVEQYEHETATEKNNTASISLMEMSLAVQNMNSVGDGGDYTVVSGEDTVSNVVLDEVEYCVEDT